MIIRKPYAFLLKHFKLIHLVLAALMTYTIYKSGMISLFFSDYFAKGENVMGQEITNGLFGIGIYISILVIIIGVLIVLFLMFNKKKPVKYYILVLINYIVIFIFINVCENIIGQMEIAQISTRTIKAFSDITLIITFAQAICFFPALVRGLGFNIKQFDFEKDLQELDITEEDREEVEIGFNFDVDKIKRRIRKNIRHIQYAYLENKLISNVIIVVLVLGIGYLGYSKLGFNEKKYSQGDYFNTTNFTMMIQDSYITNTDYKQRRLSQGKTLLILRVKIKNKYTTPVAFELGRAELNVGGNKYYPTKDYKNEVIDFGNVYDGNKISSKEQQFILCYVVPSNYLNKKMQFHYVDRINTLKKKAETTYVKVKVSPTDLRETSKEQIYKLGDIINFKNTIAGLGTFKIESYELKPEYQLSYNYCVKAGQCQLSYEYLKPNILTNYDKILLKLTYQYQVENSWSDKFSNIYNIIFNFGTIKYQIAGKMKTHNLELNQVVAKKASMGNSIYIEVLSEVSKAEKIDLEFNLRNQKITYHLK